MSRKRKPNATEALFGFAAWLVSRKERLIISCDDSAEPLAECIGRYIQINKLPPPLENYERNLMFPPVIEPEEMESDVVELELGEKQYILEQLRKAAVVLVRVIEHELTVMEGGEDVAEDDGLAFATALLVHQAGLLEASGIVDADKIEQTLDTLDASPYQYVGMGDMSTDSDTKH
tara:strand:- start:2156 stop:2683 length:528 start_codon:yes stop_codon:yes gene_type:complete